jgi:Polyprenyl synthetase
MQVGLVAINDGIVLESCIYRILQKYFRRSPQYAHLLELFHEVKYMRMDMVASYNDEHGIRVEGSKQASGCILSGFKLLEGMHAASPLGCNQAVVLCCRQHIRPATGSCWT